jgi:hypothetical protein
MHTDYKCHREVKAETRRALIFRTKYAADNHFTYFITVLTFTPFGWSIHDGLKSKEGLYSESAAVNEANRLLSV